MILCEGVGFTYPDGTRALDRIDLTIGANERVAIVGANGSGKSTLVRLWNGLLRPSAGRVLVDGRPTESRRVAELARTVALTFQDPSHQLFRATCREEVAFGARNAGLRGPALEQAVNEALERVGFANRAETNPYDLGLSHRRLLAIASVFAMGTAVVVFDEPTMGLDSGEVARVEGIVSGLADAGRTVIAISHDARFVAAAFERVVRMEAGGVVTLTSRQVPGSRSHR